MNIQLAYLYTTHTGVYWSLHTTPPPQVAVLEEPPEEEAGHGEGRLME